VSQPAVVVPTYNECENLGPLLARIRRRVPGAAVWIVDDNSPDGTGDRAEELATRDGHLFVLHRPAKAGLGTAYAFAFRQVLERGYDPVVQMDADLSHDPADIPELLDRVRSCDLVLGSRYIRGARVVDWKLRRLILSKAAGAYVGLVTRMPFTDPTGGFKCWRREVLRAIDLDTLQSSGYLFQVETTYRAYRLGFRITECPIVFTERRRGRSKIDVGIVAEALWGVLRLRLGARPCRNRRR
jgi:dolichol-phosphate mannosyltransferase